MRRKAPGTRTFIIERFPIRLRHALRIYAAENDLAGAAPAIINILENNVHLQTILARLPDTSRASMVRRQTEQEIRHLIKSKGEIDGKQ